MESEWIDLKIFKHSHFLVKKIALRKECGEHKVYLGSL